MQALNNMKTYQETNGAAIFTSSKQKHNSDRVSTNAQSKTNVLIVKLR